MGVTICSSSSPAQRMNPAGAELWVFFKGQAKNKVRVVTVTMCEYLLQLRDATKCCMFLCVRLIFYWVEAIFQTNNQIHFSPLALTSV